MQSLTNTRQLAVCLVGGVLMGSTAFAESGIGTKPVGVQPLLIRGQSDNVLSLPMQRLPVFKGYVVQSSANTLTISTAEPEGTPHSPAWSDNEFVYNAAAGQRESYYLEIISGGLEGVSFRITGNSQDTIHLDTEGDELTNYPKLGAIHLNDRVQIRPYWRVRDIFEVDGAPVIDSRPNPFLLRDEILIPNYSDASVGINKAANLIIHHLAGVGWRAAGQGTADYGDYVLPPNSVFIVRRRNTTDLTLWNTGPASLLRSVSFVPGGNGISPNDTYVALNHATPVTLDASGLRRADQEASVIKDSTSDFAREDELLAFPAAGGFNAPPSTIYYYRAGEGWKQVGTSGTVGQSVMLEPGRGYIIRKKAANPGMDWLKESLQ